ncbi:MAG: IS481 family transposase [FCB group bacterium]|nr:IS481 family transposase [FCB group bacterium]
MPWKCVDVMEERIKFIFLALQKGANFSRLCYNFGISRPTGYLWLNRYLESGSFAAVGELSRRPHHTANKTSRDLESRVIALRRKHGWGARKLRELLLRDGLDMKEATINRILKRNDLIKPEDSHRPALKRFERERPNELWQMDFKGDYKADEGRCYPLSLLDDCSRFAVGLYALSRQNTPVVYNSLVHAFETYGVPEAMLMDHGVPWWSTTNGHGLTRLSVRLVKQGIKLRFSGVRHPQTQGKVERFHRTLEHAVNHHGKPTSMSGWKQMFTYFIDEYNRIRPHEALQMDVPANRYKPSPKAYNPNPPEWEYPLGSTVKRLNPQGCFDYRHRRLFVCEALGGERVQIQKTDNKLLVKFRNVYIREINTKNGRSVSLLTPVLKT